MLTLKNIISLYMLFDWNYLIIIIRLLLLRNKGRKMGTRKNILMGIMMIRGCRGMGKNCLICLKNSVHVDIFRCEECISDCGNQTERPSPRFPLRTLRPGRKMRKRPAKLPLRQSNPIKIAQPIYPPLINPVLTPPNPLIHNASLHIPSKTKTKIESKLRRPTICS